MQFHPSKAYFRHTKDHSVGRFQTDAEHIEPLELLQLKISMVKLDNKWRRCVLQYRYLAMSSQNLEPVPMGGGNQPVQSKKATHYPPL